MPYVNKATRERLNIVVEALKASPPRSTGELNYLFTMTIKQFLKETEPLSYAAINDVLGALNGAKLEFYRRVAVDYEDEKVALNGDVY